MIMIFLFGLSFLSISAHTEFNRYKVRNVIIYGESNLMAFWLKYDNNSIKNIKISHSHIQADTKQTEQLFVLPVKYFKASIKRIKSDFKLMVKADEYPNIYIKFDEKVYERLAEEGVTQNLPVLISIGGVERKISVNYTFVDNSGVYKFYKGLATINLDDFSLITPKHFFGLFKVKETIIITFEVLLLSKSN